MVRTGQYKGRLLELIAKTSSELPNDVLGALRGAAENAGQGTAEATALAAMLENATLAVERRLPICQDTGSLLFFIDAPSGFDTLAFEEDARAAAAEATALGLLRQNCVETLTGHNTGNNVGYGSPQFNWHFERRDDLHVSLILKGGGSENMGIQYSLPDSSLGAGRDLEGVRRCILHAVQHAQGMGCAPGILGVVIGGDRATGYKESKRMLLRKIGERSKDEALASLERRVLTEANSLGIGPMGFGGKTTLLDVFIGWLCRVPASYFVSISYMCWCCRRQEMTISLTTSD